MSYVTPCPLCKLPVSSDQTVEIGGKHYTQFHCPRCVERMGVGRQSARRKLAFVVDSEGRVLRMSQVANLSATR